MNCPHCDTRMQQPANADIYVCFSCQLAISGLEVRTVGQRNFPLAEAKKEWRENWEKFKLARESGEYI